MKVNPSDHSATRLYTLRAAADALGLPYYKVQRAAKAGLIPTYSLLNARLYVKLPELILATRASGAGPMPRDEPRPRNVVPQP